MQAIRKGGAPGGSEKDSWVQPELTGATAEVVTEATVQEATAIKAVAEAPYPWILHPVIDSLFCCGGALWILLFLVLAGHRASFDAGTMGVTLLVLNALGQVFFADAHQPATLWRVYMSEGTRNSVGKFVTVCGIIAIGLGIAGLFNASFTAGLVVITLVWSIQHLLAQAFGVSLIYCYKRGYFMSKKERDIFFYLFQTALALFAVRVFTYQPFAASELYGLKIPFWGPLPEWLFYIALAAFQINVLLFVGMVVKKRIKEKKLFPLPALAATLTALLIPLSNHWQPIAFVVFIQTFYHASQYMVVTTAFYLKEQGLPENVPFSKISSMLTTKVMFKYTAIITVLGLIMFVGLPQLLSAIGFERSVVMCAVYCMFNIHHYLTDAAIWRLKDPVVRKILVS